MKPLLIGLYGKARSGKDTVGGFLNRKYAFERYSFASPLRRGLETMFNLPHTVWEGPAKEVPVAWLGKSPRQLMQSLGTEWGRQHVHPEVWLRLMLRRWDQVKLLDEPRLCVTDVRFDNEAEAIKRQRGVIIRLIRPGVEAVQPHVSEAGISDDHIDFTIVNSDSLKALEAAVDEIARRLSL